MEANFQFKGGLFTLTSLSLLNSDLSHLEEQIQKAIQQAPKFFYRMPIIIDLQKLTDQAKIDMKFLLACLHKNNLYPIGIRGGSIEQQEAAFNLGLPVISSTRSDTRSSDSPRTYTPAEVKSTTSYKTQLVTQPVRSGQQIYARSSDLIVLCSVSPGAELMADGHIHVYGSLKGRALAGVSGNQEARIFCYDLNAELIAIAGHYWINEDLPLKKHRVQIYLKNERLQMDSI